MFDENGRFVLKDYQRAPAFSSFLPGIAGPLGVPAWVYYNNRGQAVCSFGAKDKDHAIMEFCAAHTAYQNTARTGFRTFARVNGQYTELLKGSVTMHIGAADLLLHQQAGALDVQARYCGLPDHRTAGLIRTLTVTNTGDETVELEVLDGMPAVVCYGVEQNDLKNMPQLSKAWMQAEFGADGTTRFAVRASMADTACVTPVEGVNFCLATDETGARLKPLVQPSLVFAEDTGLERAENFARTPLQMLCGAVQVTQNIFPCCFVPAQRRLHPGESLRICSLYGQAENRGVLEKDLEGAGGPDWFEKQFRRAVQLGRELTDPIETRTADPVFDEYCRQTYLDNLLRGGTPVFFDRKAGRPAVVYLYSRKHGDPEREYNYFSLGGEYYAQGNGNFRDVNQNRRSDVLFHPRLEDANVQTFYDLIQTDGYNPLVVLPSTFRLEADARRELCGRLPEKLRQRAGQFLEQAFTPGRLAMAAEDWGLSPQEGERFVEGCLAAAQEETNAEFQEGYWCDHWTYDLDLVENFLAVYPERKERLLFGGRICRWYAAKAAVLPLEQRCRITPSGLRQYAALDLSKGQQAVGSWLAQRDGGAARSTLMEKLLLLCAIKTATLDPAGMGVEMEGGKPGWYDALNGLPGLFGSSVAESCELERLLRFTAEALQEKTGCVEMYSEMAWLLREASRLAAEPNDRTRWQAMTSLREEYRQKTADTLSGERVRLDCAVCAGMLHSMLDLVEKGLKKAESFAQEGVLPTYFSFEASDAVTSKGGWLPGAMNPHPLPIFLEGAVRRMKTGLDPKEKAALADAVQESSLYDRQLQMYKINASLEHTSYEIGRARAFTPGWLENESVWLHMEYKYLLELLKNGLYERFFRAFEKAMIPFLDPTVYGRSPLENVSFIASSANPDPALRGRGFVARMSGATAEFLQMWQLMFFGPAPFAAGEKGLSLFFAPALPARLIPPNGVVHCTFLGRIKVTLLCQATRDMIPGRYRAVSYTVTFEDGSRRSYDGPALPDGPAHLAREGKLQAIEVSFIQAEEENHASESDRF